MVRFVGATILVVALLFFWNKDKIELFKQNIIESFNPAVKEKRLIEDLDRALSLMGESVNKNDRTKAESLVRQAQEIVSELKSTNAKTDLGANISNLINKILPFSETPTPTWLPPVCKN